ncbi:MAG: aryl-sulfate sulfotransferase [Melioribacteraceae bacterium]|nr:aryl-sulfate sulfotransferase [Melioribacteraceae bacterium]
MILRKIILFLFVVSSVGAQSYQYIFPKPGTDYHRKASTIILRFGEKINHIDKITAAKNFKIIGSKSGLHEVDIIISTDEYTLIADPITDFVEGENVIVFFAGGVKTDNETSLPSIKFNFTIAENEIPKERFLRYEYNRRDSINGISENRPVFDLTNSVKENTHEVQSINGVAVPSDYPEVKVEINTNPAPGYIYMNNWGGTPYLMILNGDGTPLFYKKMSSRARDFKIQSTGEMTYRLAEGYDKFFGMDSGFNIIREYTCGPYGTDEHELMLQKNGNALMIGLEWRTVDMSKMVANGKPNATVVGNHVVEVDKNNNIVFEWRCWDNYKITDAIGVDLTANYIDYIHMNAIDIDMDDNLVVSSRHLNEVTKINKTTGEMIWRFGGPGNKNNQFTFINDSFDGFSWQHDIRSIGNNHYTIFDNGNFHSPKISRAVEYLIDEVNKTATLVWEYKDPKKYYTSWMGNAQRLSNGNTLICWADGSLPKVSEVTPSGEKVYQLDFIENYHCYRAFKFNSLGKASIPYLVAESYTDKVRLIFNKFGDSDVASYDVYAGTAGNSLIKIGNTKETYFETMDLDNNTDYFFAVKAVYSSGNASEFSNKEKIFVRLIQAGENMLLNSDFSAGSSGWVFQTFEQANANLIITSNNEAFINVTNSGVSDWNIELLQKNISVVKGKKYFFQYDAAAGDTRVFYPRITRDGGEHEDYSRIGAVALGKTKKTFTHIFTMNNETDLKARLIFQCGGYNPSILIDNVIFKEDVFAGADEIDTLLPNNFGLIGNYPNPFNPNTIIKYSLPAQGSVRISIYNLLGELISQKLLEHSSGGIFEYNFKGASLSSGVYISTIEKLSGNFENSGLSKLKMILIK